MMRRDTPLARHLAVASLLGLGHENDDVEILLRIEIGRRHFEPGRADLLHVRSAKADQIVRGALVDGQLEAGDRARPVRSRSSEYS